MKTNETNRTSPSAVPDPPPSEAPKINSKMQPPLPLDPPLDTPDNLNIQVKQEVEDVKPETSQLPTTKVSQETIEKSKTIQCRDYLRGLCKRQDSCRYVHKYTFCHEYQNSVCTYADCKYVHASISEEQNYYRTGILPPHALAFRRKASILLPPPPPPPPAENKTSQSLTTKRSGTESGIQESESESEKKPSQSLTTKRSGTESGIQESESESESKKKIRLIKELEGAECIPCKRMRLHEDLRDELHAQLVSYELNLVPPCRRSYLYTKILKFIIKNRYGHNIMLKDDKDIK